MPLDLNQIPATTDAIAATPTRALSAVKDTFAARRTVLRGVALSSLALGATVLSWSPLGGQRAARAESGPHGLQGWDANDCRDAYPNGYNETPDTGGTYKNEEAACFGGRFMGDDYCESGWHRKGTREEGSVKYEHEPISTACGTSSTKNSWKWKTPNGKVWRCSDGMTTVTEGESTRTYLTICRAPA